MQYHNPFSIVSGNANRELAQRIADYLEMPVCKTSVSRFSDGEVAINIAESVRNRHVFIVQPTCQPANDHLMELLIIIDALKRASAAEISAVVPYYGYARQDRKVAPRQPITAKLIANLLHAAGATRLITLDLHAGQIQGFFEFPVDHLYALPIFLEDIRKKFCSNTLPSDLVVVSPDAGGADRARNYAKRLNIPLAIIDKRRSAPGEAEAMNVIGDIEGKRAIVIDDLIDTAGTLAKGAEALMKKGAAEVYAYASHAVFSGNAIKNIDNSCIKEVIVTDTIPLSETAKCSGKIRVLSCAPLIGEAMRRMYNSESISSLFE